MAVVLRGLKPSLPNHREQKSRLHQPKTLHEQLLTTSLRDHTDLGTGSIVENLIEQIGHRCTIDRIVLPLWEEDAIIEIGIVLTEIETEIETETIKDLVIIGTNQDLHLNQLVNKLLLLLPLLPLNLKNHPPPLLQPPNKTMVLEPLLLVPVVIVLVIHHCQVPIQ